MNRVLVLVPGYLPGFKSGGPVRTVSNMVETLGDMIHFNIICLDRDLGDLQSYRNIIPHKWNQVGKGYVLYITRGFCGFINLVLTLVRHDYDFVHINSFFSFQFSIIPIIYFKIINSRVPLIIGPRGEFSKGALAQKSIKKLIFIKLAQLLRLHRAVIWHASSLYEADDIRRVMGLSTKIHIAVDIAEPITDLVIPQRNDQLPIKIVFISRIAPKKNLQYAINVLSAINRPVVFDVYGPIEDPNYWSICSNSARMLPKNIEFNYLGPVHPDRVSLILSTYDLFFFPTLGENFGHVIAEALFSGLPVLISDQTPWRELNKENIGWDIPLTDHNSFVNSIRKCIELTPIEYLNWRKHIRAWAMKNIGNKEAIEANYKLFEIR